MDGFLEDQLADAKEAFKNAHESGNKEAAQALAQRVFELETRVGELKKAEQESTTNQTGWKSPAAAAAVGATIGAVTNPIRGAVHDVITPNKPKAAPVSAGPAPDTFGGQDWTKALTGVDVPGAQMNKSSLDVGQRMAETVGRGGPLAGGTISPGGIMMGPELGAKPPVAPTPTTAQRTAQTGKNLLEGFVADHQPTRPMDIVKGGTRGALTGAALADIPQQLSQGNYGTAASDVGISSGNILHGLARTPKGKALGALLGLGSGTTRMYQGMNELMPPEQKAQGGLVGMSGGGLLTNALTQTAVNAPFIASTGAGITKNVAKGAYAPAIEEAAGLALSMAPLNPLTAAMSLMAPGEAGAGSTADDWHARKAAEKAAMEKAQRQYEHEQFMHNKIGANAPKFLEQYQAKIRGFAPGGLTGYDIGGKVKLAKKMSSGLDLGNILPSAAFKAAPEQTVTNPLRNEYPGVYKRPDVIAKEAAARVAPEDPMLKRLFGVTRDDLFEMSKRQGNEPGFIPGASKNPKGSAAAEAVMNPRNTQRLIDVLGEVKTNAPDLYRGMHAWYTMDPQYHRMVELMGEEKAKQMYHRLNTFGGIESPNLPVPVEFNRASAANWLAEQGRMPDWIKYGGLRDKHLVEGMPADIMGVPGRVGHQRASTSQNKFMETGEHGMISPKAPPYIQASSVPELGFQTDLPVGDAHWSRSIGLPDVRTGKEVSASVSTPELQQLAPWWKNDVAGAVDLESVPAQAISWGAFSPQTGVKTAIGAGKLELQAIQMAEAAKRLGISPETARDMILMGEARAGKKQGGLV